MRKEKTMKKLYMIGTVALCLLMVSCNSDPGTVSESTSQDTESTVSTTASVAMETDVNDEEYASYIEKYGEAIGNVFYGHRETGSPNMLSDCVPGDHSDIRMKPTKEQYSLSDQDMQWGITIIDVSEKISLKKYSEHLNVEKFDGTTWVRQAVFDMSRYMQTPSATVNPPSSDVLKRRLISAKLRVMVKYIYPAPTPGEYRFVFYASVEQDGKTENRMYYIPFEVVE